MLATSLVSVATVPTDDASTRNVERTRSGLIGVVIFVTSMAGLGVVLLFPRPDAAGQYTYRQLEAIRDFWWAFFIFAGANLILQNVALAIAGWRLVPTRGAIWATAGGALLTVGAVLYGVGIGGWATIGYYATNPAAVDAAHGAKLLDFVNNDFGRTFGVVIPGGVLVLIGTIMLAVALWWAGSLPRWVPILLASLVATFFLPTRGFVGLVSELPHLVASMAIAWFLWRRFAGATEGTGHPA